MRNPFRWLLIAFTGLVVCSLAVSVIGADPIKIGLHAPLTGFAAADGLSVAQSVSLLSGRSTPLAASTVARYSS